MLRIRSLQEKAEAIPIYAGHKAKIISNESLPDSPIGII